MTKEEIREMDNEVLLNKFGTERFFAGGAGSLMEKFNYELTEKLNKELLRRLKFYEDKSISRKLLARCDKAHENS